MPKTPRPLDPPQPQLVRCEDCQNFTGEFHTWGCAKGYEAPHKYVFVKHECADNAPMTRDEQIFKRFRLGAAWHGDEELKKARSTVRRAAGALRSIRSHYEKYLSGVQIESISGTAETLAGLADDIERAEKLAREVKKKADAKREDERRTRRLSLVLTALDVNSKKDIQHENLHRLAEDILAFAGNVGKVWWKATKRDTRHFDLFIYAGLPEAMSKVSAMPTAAHMDRLLASVAAHLEELDDRGGGYSVSLADFAEFRKSVGHHQRIMQIVRSSQIKPDEE
ncbi:conserved hypothetical protein [Paraburkholderia tropica]|uniref:hypothetical protein n=1 Tax=Paraburkholderia tropica TaxID=92647 RepID=UPI001CB5D362|nr:hypothetical protein [Paraburkholderia tropica]CAG9230152.1 conserved hypothetical protein [Paraburkholderia tropica]